MSMDIETFDQKRYRCPHCRKSWASKTRARRHVEYGCVRRDPSVKSCGTCEHFNPGADANWDEPGVEPYCREGLETEGHPMDWPKDCPEHKTVAWLGKGGES